MAHAFFASSRSRLRVGLLVVISLAAGCRFSPSKPESGLDLRLSADWRPVDRSTWSTPGAPIAAWSGPEGSSFVVYRALPIPRGTAEAIVAMTVNRLRNLPGFEILAGRTETIAGQPAARIEVIAPGNGDDLAPSGVGAAVALRNKPLTPTREITIGFARQAETLCFVWRTPEAAYGRIAPRIDSILAGLTLPPDRKSSSY
ncbi:MAG: hypothetical protein P4L85_06210 [Paludisphaera borealis]|uniref:hypothetical protein n=1 Tax=Paludisphaera borealis TaxID=1387353 RepID=UPI00284AB277|nr:hypothetical protein [Paludisphaera borealis]MDR3618926.1 hypothetical protein [Paludisphaera borealis]